MKKYISCLLVLLALALPMLGMEADAATIVDSGSCGENLTWTLDSDGLLTISGSGEMYGEDDYWPYEIPWYSLKHSILSVVIEEGVTSIGDEAFYECSNLSSITLPSSVTNIYYSAFQRCISLSSITFQKGLTAIGNSAFSGCEILRSITLPEGLTEIGAYAFSGCYSLRNITLPESLTSIGNGAFSGCAKLTSINIPKGVTSIGGGAFAWYDWANGSHSGLTGIWVDNGNPNYSSDNRGVLFDKNKTQLIQAPGEITGAYSIPESVTSVEGCAFLGCTKLTSITIPDSVTSISGSAFEGCTRLSSITIPDSVTSIGNDAFAWCHSLTNITIPGSVTHISESTFFQSNLKSITLMEGVTTIESYAFQHCSYLRNITIPESVYLIRADAFYGTFNLETVHYAGTQAQVEEMTILYGNEDLENATWHYECNGKTCKPEGSPFVDIYSGDYYCDPVLWAVNNGITNGLSENTFGPAETCTRGQIVTFLQRACDRWSGLETYDIPFWDVTWDDYFCHSVLWAVENGITSGMGDGSFAPGAPCTRGQVATFLWRACGQPAPSGTNIFTDIAPGAYYYDAVLWAVENGITNGMGDGTFAPDAPCTRGQIVTFLYRTMA